MTYGWFRRVKAEGKRPQAGVACPHCYLPVMATASGAVSVKDYLGFCVCHTQGVFVREIQEAHGITGNPAVNRITQYDYPMG